MQNEKTMPPVNVLFAGVTNEDLEKWKLEHETIFILTVKLSDNKSLTGYFSKPTKADEETYLNYHLENKIAQAGRFLLNKTFIGGDKELITNSEAAQKAQARLWVATSVDEYRNTTKTFKNGKE